MTKLRSGGVGDRARDHEIEDSNPCLGSISIKISIIKPSMEALDFGYFGRSNLVAGSHIVGIWHAVMTLIDP